MRYIHILFTLYAFIAYAFAAKGADAFDVTVEISDRTAADVSYFYYPGGTDIDNQLIRFNSENQATVHFPAASEYEPRSVYVTPLETGSVKNYLKSIKIYNASGKQIYSRTYNTDRRQYADIPLEAANGIVKIDVGELELNRLNLTVDGDTNNILLMIGQTTVSDLELGEQVIEYSPADKYLYVRTAGSINRFYYIAVNGRELEWQTDTNEGKKITHFYYADIVNDDNATIITEMNGSDIMPVGINVNVPEAVTEVLVDGESIDNAVNNTTLLPYGRRMTLRLNPEFDVLSCTINGAYITVENSTVEFTVNNKRSVKIDFSPFPTSVEKPSDTLAKPTKGIYDMAGRRIETDPSLLPAGVYIIDGVKTLIHRHLY